MTIQDLGSLGELVAAIATVATLTYLAVQIRQNTRSLRANAFQDSTRSANDWSLIFIHHPETIALFRRGLSQPSSLDPSEAIEFSHLIETFFRNYSAVRELASDHLIPIGILEMYEENIRHWFSRPDFRSWCKSRFPAWSEVAESAISA